MEDLNEDFVSHEHRKFKYVIGKVLASSLSGFLAGIIVTTIVFLTIFHVTLRY